MKKTVKNTECNLVDFILGLFVIYVFFKCLNYVLANPLDCLGTALLCIFGFIFFFPAAMLTDDFSKDFDFIPGWIVKILRIVGVAELVGLIGGIIWFVFIY